MLTRIIILLSLTVLSACAVEQPAITERFVWPPPPDIPRIEWLAVYSSQLDLPKSSFRVFKETIVGEDRPITMKRPIEARIDNSADKIYVADMDTPAVFVFDRKGLEMRQLAIDPSINRNGFIKPISLSLDQERTLYILDAYSKSILIYNNDETFQRIIPLNDIASTPVAIAFDRIQRILYISDAKSNKVIAIDPLSGKIRFTVGRPGELQGEFNRPVGIVVNSKGELIVADTFNARIQVFDNKGNFVRMFGSRGDGNTQFQLIKGVAVDPDDNIYVTDSRSNNIKIFSSTGLPLLVFGGYYAVASSGKLAAGGFALPVGIDIDSYGTIAVVDQLNVRVQLFRYLRPLETNPVK